MRHQAVEQDAQHDEALVDCGNCNRRVKPTSQSVVRASARPPTVPGLFGRMRTIIGCPECQAQFG